MSNIYIGYIRFCALQKALAVLGTEHLFCFRPHTGREQDGALQHGRPISFRPHTGREQHAKHLVCPSERFRPHTGRELRESTKGYSLRCFRPRTGREPTYHCGRQDRPISGFLTGNIAQILKQIFKSL